MIACKLACQAGKFPNCAPEISKIYYKLYRERQNCVPEISVATYKLSRLVGMQNLNINLHQLTEDAQWIGDPPTIMTENVLV